MSESGDRGRSTPVVTGPVPRNEKPELAPVYKDVTGRPIPLAEGWERPGGERPRENRHQQWAGAAASLQDESVGLFTADSRQAEAEYRPPVSYPPTAGGSAFFSGARQAASEHLAGGTPAAGQPSQPVAPPAAPSRPVSNPLQLSGLPNRPAQPEPVDRPPVAPSPAEPPNEPSYTGYVQNEYPMTEPGGFAQPGPEGYAHFQDYQPGQTGAQPQVTGWDSPQPEWQQVQPAQPLNGYASPSVDEYQDQGGYAQSGYPGQDAYAGQGGNPGRPARPDQDEYQGPGGYEGQGGNPGQEGYPSQDAYAGRGGNRPGTGPQDRYPSHSGSQDQYRGQDEHPSQDEYRPSTGPQDQYGGPDEYAAPDQDRTRPAAFPQGPQGPQGPQDRNRGQDVWPPVGNDAGQSGAPGWDEPGQGAQGWGPTVRQRDERNQPQGHQPQGPQPPRQQPQRNQQPYTPAPYARTGPPDGPVNGNGRLLGGPDFVTPEDYWADRAQSRQGPPRGSRPPLSRKAKYGRIAAVVALVLVALAIGRFVSQFASDDEALDQPFVKAGRIGEPVTTRWADITALDVQGSACVVSIYNDNFRSPGVFLVVPLKIVARGETAMFTSAYAAIEDGDGRVFTVASGGRSGFEPGTAQVGVPRYASVTIEVPPDAAVGARLLLSPTTLTQAYDDMADIDLGITQADLDAMVKKRESVVVPTASEQAPAKDAATPPTPCEGPVAAS